MMRPDPSVARDITPDLLGRFLTARGWRLRRSSGKVSLYVLEGGQDDPVEIVVPASYSRSAPSSIQNALVTLSQVLERPIDEVAREIRTMGFDVIKHRVPDEYVRDDAVELRLAEEFVKGMRQLLTSSVNTELNPLPAYAKATNAATEFSGACRFGHTFRGSFGFVVELPVGLNLEPMMPGIEHQSPPLGRRVTQRLARGLRTVDQAAASDDPSLIVDEYAVGLSANMCDDIADILEETGLASLKMELDFSPEWPPAVDLLQVREFTIRHSHVDLLRSAAETMRADAPTPDVAVSGRIKELEAEGNPADLLEDSARRIVINWQTPDGGLIKVHVQLSPADYLLAVDAHKAGRPVSVVGTLRRAKKTYHLDQPSAFIVR